MSIKLSELNNNQLLFVGEDCVMSKEDYIKEIQIQGPIYREVYTAKEYRPNINAKSMLDRIIESEAANMYEDWENSIREDITETDIAELQNVLDKIFSSRKNVSYVPDEEVEIDIKI